MSHATLKLEDIDAEMLDARTKGIPGGVAPFRVGDIAARGWNVGNEDLPLPVVILKRSCLEHNIGVMREYCRQHEVELAPHGKTTMAPQIFGRQLAAGAWGITAATVEQLQVYRHYGVPRVIFANQLVGRAHLSYVCREMKGDPSFDLHPFIDSVAAVEQLAAAAEEHGLRRPVRVLLEVGYFGGRTGARSLEDVVQIRQALKQRSGRVELIGVAGFEGLLPVASRLPATAQPEGNVTIESHLQDMADAVDELLATDALPDSFIVTAGGSAAFDKVIEGLSGRWEGRAKVVLRSGCYVTHDHLMYRDSPLQNPNPGEQNGGAWLQPALELWSYVHSTPEPGRALLTFGRRDVGSDYGLPVPLRHVASGSRAAEPTDDWSIEQLNDQHAHLRHSAGDALAVGDRVVCGISHPCTTFDKWKVIPEVDDDYNVVGAVRTFF